MKRRDSSRSNVFYDSTGFRALTIFTPQVPSNDVVHLQASAPRPSKKSRLGVRRAGDEQGHRHGLGGNGEGISDRGETDDEDVRIDSEEEKEVDEKNSGEGEIYKDGDVGNTCGCMRLNTYCFCDPMAFDDQRRVSSEDDFLALNELCSLCKRGKVTGGCLNNGIYPKQAFDLLRNTSINVKTRKVVSDMRRRGLCNYCCNWNILPAKLGNETIHTNKFISHFPCSNRPSSRPSFPTSCLGIAFCFVFDPDN